MGEREQLQLTDIHNGIINLPNKFPYRDSNISKNEGTGQDILCRKKSIRTTNRRSKAAKCPGSPKVQLNWSSRSVASWVTSSTSAYGLSIKISMTVNLPGKTGAEKYQFRHHMHSPSQSSCHPCMGLDWLSWNKLENVHSQALLQKIWMK